MKKTDNKIPLSKLLIVILSIILFVSSALFIISLWENQQNFNNESTVSPTTYNSMVIDGKSYVPSKNIETILLIGLDKFDKDIDNSAYRNDQQADFLVLIALNNDKKTCSAIQLNRDTMVKMNILGVAGMEIGTAEQQLALAHTYGNGHEVSCRNTVNAVSNLLFGIKIDHYISITMDAVPVCNDLVGGVTLEVLDDFSGIDDTLIKGETVTLTSEQSLTYVRSRYGMENSTNTERMKRQRQYLNVLHNEMRTCISSEEGFSLTAVNSLSDYMISDYLVQDMKELFDKAFTYEYTGLSDIPGKSVEGERFMEFYPDVSEMKKLVAELFYIRKD